MLCVFVEQKATAQPPPPPSSPPPLRNIYIIIYLSVIACDCSLTHTHSLSVHISLGSCVLCVPVCLSLTETFHVGFHRKATPACPGFTIHIEFGLNYSD